MRSKIISLAPYMIVLGLDFYLLPCLMQSTGAAMLLMLCVMPLTAFVAAVAYGLRGGFSPLLSIAAVLLFIPTVFLYYNASAWVYALFYGAAVLAGTGAGSIFYGKR